MVNFAPPPHFEFGEFIGRHGGKVRYGVCASPLKPARGSVILCPGRSEFIEKYFPVISQLTTRGFTVFVIDWPGQGASDRQLNDPLKGHIDHFDTYVGALEDALERAGKLPRPRVVLAHSMGGGISLSAMIQDRLSVDAAAFSAPMWGIKAPKGMRTVAKTLNKLGLSKAYVAKPEDESKLADSKITYSEAEWQRNIALAEALPEYSLGPPTWGWAKAGVDLLESFEKDGVIEKIKIPVFVGRAGDELLVDNLALAKIVARLPDVESREFPAAKHELMFERTATKAVFWQAFDRLLLRAGI